MAKTERVGVYPGTFDPTTNGHMDIIRRGARVLDRLVIGVAVNAGKGPLFSLDERVEMVKDEVAAIDDPKAGAIEVKPFDSLLMQFAESENADCILRGLRAVSDFDYEFQMAGMNARLNPDIEILFLMASEHHQFIASRLGKEIAALGGEIGRFVSPDVARRVNERFGRLDLQAANE
jgi:pantetheine-phosphate adenylyltransferase